MRKKISVFRGIFSFSGKYTVLGGEAMIIMIRKKRFLRAAGVLAAAVVLGAGIFTAAGGECVHGLSAEIQCLLCGGYR